jgi:hypothetical protein
MHINKGLLSSNKRINPHKNNYNSNGAKLSPTHALAKNKPKKPTNTLVATMDLDIHIYELKKHIFGNNISNRYKNMVNSPKVYFIIK